MPDIIEITDFSAPGPDIYAIRSEGQLLHFHEPDPGLFIAESPRVIERALDAGYRPVSFLLERKHISGEAEEILRRCKGIPVYTADSEVLAQLTGFKLTRGALCAMQRKPLPSPAQICREARRIVILEDVVNPTNIGAIFRSAAALNMDAVLLTSACSDPLYRRSVRVSMGTVFQIPWTYLEKNCGKWPMSGMDLLREMGFRTAAMALREDSVNITDSRLRNEEKLAVIMGTEGEGLSDDTISACDYTVRIPMSHDVDSLNVAAASAIAFWQLGQR